MIRSFRWPLKCKALSKIHTLFRMSKNNYILNQSIAEKTFKLKEEEKFTKRNFRDTYLNSNIDVLLKLLSRDYRSLSIDKKFELLRIVRLHFN